MDCNEHRQAIIKAHGRLQVARTDNEWPRVEGERPHDDHAFQEFEANVASAIHAARAAGCDVDDLDRRRV
jgi:hypothetical protein